MHRGAHVSIGLALLVAIAGCTDGAVPQPDVGVDHPANDLAAPDLGTTVEPPADLATTPSGPGDLATADSGSTPSGLTWPAGQSFPSFGPLGALDVVDLTGLAKDRQTLLVTLAGLVNRTQPRIYGLDGGGEGKTFWLDKLGVAHAPVADPFSLILKYKAEITGIVIYDDAQIDTINLATTIAGVADGIVASPALSATLTADPYRLPVIADLRTNHFSSKLDIYRYEYDHYANKATHRLICGLDPTIAGNLRDYAVATRSLMIWLDPRNADEKALASQFFALLAPNSPYLGWWPDEGSGVAVASTAAIPVFAADWASNLTVFGGTPRGIHVPARPPKPMLQNKIYVTLIMSDGDNLQENQHLIPLKWADPNRGKVPIAWTTTPALVDAAPVILNYYQDTATANDVLISGPSGLGYTYPDWWSAAAFAEYARRSATYLEAAGLRVITIWNKDPANLGNDGKDLSAANANAYTDNMQHLLGVTLQGGWIRFLKELTVLNAKLPLLRLAQTYGNDEATLEAGINNGAFLWSHTTPLFIAVQGNMNSDNINPTTFYQVQQHFASDSNYVFVRADHFFQLLREANQLPVDP